MTINNVQEMFFVHFHKNSEYNARYFVLQQILRVTLCFGIEPAWIDFWAWTESFAYLELTFLLFYWQYPYFLLIHHYQLLDTSAEE